MSSPHAAWVGLGHGVGQLSVAGPADFARLREIVAKDLGTGTHNVYRAAGMTPPFPAPSSCLLAASSTSSWRALSVSPGSPCRVIFARFTRHRAATASTVDPVAPI